MRLRALVIVAVTLLAAATGRADPPSSTAAVLRYFERPRTLSHVAARVHLSVQEIADFNHIKDPGHFRANGLVLPDTTGTRFLPPYIPWTPAPERRTCDVVPWKLGPAKEKGCREAYCGSGPGGARACVCREDVAIASAEGIGFRMTIVSPEGTTTLPVSITGWNPFGASLVDVTSVDLDGDGEPETLVSWLGAVSNGIAEESRTLFVLRGNQEILRYDSGEFTAATAPVKVGDQCHLASSHYEEYAHPLQGEALYLVERTFDAVTFRMDRTLVGRRFSDKARYELPDDPLAALPAARERPVRGWLAAVSRDKAGDLNRVSVRTANATQTFRASRSYDEPALRFGDGRARRVFPPELVVASRLVVSRAVVERYPSSSVRVVWVDGT